MGFDWLDTRQQEVKQEVWSAMFVVAVKRDQFGSFDSSESQKRLNLALTLLIEVHLKLLLHSQFHICKHLCGFFFKDSFLLFCLHAVA